MPKIKGSAISAVRDIAKKQGEEFYQKWLASLPQEEQDTYNRLLAISWYPLPMSENCGIGELAKMLYPNDSKALRKVGALQVKESLNSVYRLFLKIPSLDFVLGKSVQMWKTFHDTGEFNHTKEGNQSIITIKKYETMPSYLRQVIWGSIEGITDLVGKEVDVQCDESNSACWKWTVKY